ncbi:MAG: helix-turn-helix domain-containing protein [Verrucomicrobiae bacterium]|nr:helix-turn-helix domain-containing protein [Verrucomicrobiae bacterium]
MSAKHGSEAEALSLTELAARTGCPARTIRYYIARGLLPGPLKAGRGARYGPQHCQRLEEIRRWQAKGLTLAEIARHLAQGAQRPARPLEKPTTWWSYQLAPEVVVQVRADTGPWRLRQILRALQEAAVGLAQPTTEGEPQ